MKLFGLYGESGTGKSHIAERIGLEIGASLIIDDGLLVSHGRVLAGHSAKFEATRMGAVKRAIFADLGHRAEVRHALQQAPAASVMLVLGTSQRMIRLICESLGLTGEISWIPIETVVGEEEMSLAQNLRNYGMHAIPIVEATVEETRLRHLLERIRVRMLRHDDSSDGGRASRSRRPDATVAGSSQPGPATTDHLGTDHSGTDRAAAGHKARRRLTANAAHAPTVVNPLFAGGAVYIHPRAIRQSILQLVRAEHHPFQVTRVSIDIGQYPKVLLRVKVPLGVPIPPAAERLIASVRQYLQTYLGLSIVQLELQVSSVVIPAKQKPDKEATEGQLE